MLSILVPAFRVHNWEKMYKTILTAWSHPFELIIVSHIELPDSLKNIPNIKWIYDSGNPTRKRQIALLNATQKYVTWFIDDGEYIPNSLNELYDEIGFYSPVSLKYGDCPEGHSWHSIMGKDEYYDFSYSAPLLTMPNIPEGCKILSFGVMPTHLLCSVGGWDCLFETLALADSDLSIRLNKLGFNVKISKKVILKMLHIPGAEGDHAPVHYAQVEHDEPLFFSIYFSNLSKDRKIIDINNWKESPEVWTRRNYAV